MRLCRVADPDRYLMPRGGIYYYWRRIPSPVARLDFRSRSGLVRISLKTDDLCMARRKRDVFEAADNDYWSALLVEEGDEGEAALRRYRAAVRRAEALGFAYRTSAEIASGPLEDLVRRVLAILPEAAPPAVEAAVLGREDRPEASWDDALEVYKTEIVWGELAKKSPGQLKRWETTQRRAIANLMQVIGDKPVAETTREDGRAFYKHMLDRVAPKDPSQKPASASTGNKQICAVRRLYSAYFEHVDGDQDRSNPFSGFGFSESKLRTRDSFTCDWIRDRILAPGALAGMNDELRAITLAQVETGCRPGELCNIAPEDIYLDGDVPYIHIRARTTPGDKRQLKTEESDREIPLVGVSLEAIRRHPRGFPRYKDKESAYSAAANKYFAENGLKPSRGHTVYSFRHSFEDRMLESGVDLEVRAVLMGHKIERPRYGKKGSLAYRERILSAMAFDFDPAIV